MSTPWNFSYSVMQTPTKFNIRPTYIIPNLSILGQISSTNTLGGFLSTDLENIVAGMQVYNTTVFGVAGRAVISKDTVAKTVLFGGAPVSANYTLEFTFDTNPNVETFTNSLVPLVGQQIHDNFFYVSEGLMNHQERITLIEAYSTTSVNPTEGFVHYNGFQEQEGAFYGSSTLQLIASSKFPLTEVYDPSNVQIFTIAMDEGIVEATPLSSKFHTINLGANKTAGTTFPSITDYCTYANSQLNNNGSGFNFTSSQIISGSWIASDTATKDWNAIPQGFLIRIDDAPDEELITIDFLEADRPSTLYMFYTSINSKLNSAGLFAKVIASDYTGRLRISGISNKSGAGWCTRIELIEKAGQTFLADAMWITPSTIFDFSTSLQFLPNPTATEYSFTVTSANATIGAIYSNNGNVFTVTETIVAGIILKVATTGSAPSLSGTLTRISGTGDSTITFSAFTTNILLAGLNSSFKMVIKDDEFFPALQTSGFNSGIFTGNYITFHSKTPVSTSTTLNFDGNFKATALYCTSLYTSVLTATAITSITLSLTGAFIGTSGSFTTINTSGLATLNSLSVNTTSLFTGDTVFTGAITANGATTLSNYTYITNTLHFNDYTLYRAPLLSTGVLQPADAPINDDTQYLLYNGNFGAYNVDVVGTLRIHGTTKASGRFWMGTATTNDEAGAIYTLNYNGPFRANTAIGNSTRASKTNIVSSGINALQMIKDTLIVDYNFKTSLEVPRIGFIAEDTNILLATPEQNGIDITNCIGIILKAIQELADMIKE